MLRIQDLSMLSVNGDVLVYNQTYPDNMLLINCVGTSPFTGFILCCKQYYFRLVTARRRTSNRELEQTRKLSYASLNNEQAFLRKQPLNSVFYTSLYK